MSETVDALHRRWTLHDRAGVVDDLAYMDKKPALLAALGLALRLPEADLRNLLRRLEVKLRDRG